MDHATAARSAVRATAPSASAAAAPSAAAAAAAPSAASSAAAATGGFTSFLATAFTLSGARESSRRLATLLQREFGGLADFLVALAEFDAQEMWRVLGYASLFDYLHRELGLSRGAAHYRKVAARLVRRFPEVESALRNGHLCITSIVELSRVMTEENRDQVLPRFFHCSKQQAKALAVEILPAVTVPRREVVTAAARTVAIHPGERRLGAGAIHPGELDLGAGAIHPDESASGTGPGGAGPSASTPSAAGPYAAGPYAAAPARDLRDTADPITVGLRRLHITVSTGFLDKLERAREGQSHLQPDATAEQVLEAALDLLLAAQEKRRAAVPPKVKREVRERDGGRCQWPTHDGGICGSTVRTQIDHVVPRALGGPSTVENCRVLCAIHNREAARRVFGDELVDRYAPQPPEPRTPVAREDAGAAAGDAEMTKAPEIRGLRSAAVMWSRDADDGTRDLGLPRGSRPDCHRRVWREPTPEG